MLVSLLIMALVVVALQLLGGNAGLATIVDGFLTITIGGIAFFGAFVFLWGLLICWVVVPFIWHLQATQVIEVPMRAAISAFVVALIGVGAPLLFFGRNGINSLEALCYFPASIAIIVAPLVAYYVHRADAKQDHSG